MKKESQVTSEAPRVISACGACGQREAIGWVRHCEDRGMSRGILVFKEGEEILAIVIRSDFSKEGIEFFTPADFSQQIAYMQHKKGKTIKAHRHNLVKREVHFTQEVLFIKRGRLKVDLYSSSKEYMESVILEPGDIILLASGGHGFEILEDLEMIEVKQGPYAGDQDKSYLEAEP